MTTPSLKVHCPHCDALAFPDVFANSIEPDARVPHLLPIRVVAKCGECNEVIGWAMAMIEAKWEVEGVEEASRETM